MNASETVPILVIAGVSSGVGKTTVTLGLLEALRGRGLAVQAFKVGPDFIDAAYHALATGQPSYNLDGWMCGPEQVVATVGERAAQADLALVEGVMGCFDGTDGLSEDGSTAQIAKWFGAPVILVLDAGALVRSAAAVDTRSPTAVVSWPPVSGCRCQLAGGTGAPSHVALPLPLRWRPCGLNLGQEPWPRRIERQVLAVPREMAARYSERILAGS